jgi:putative DNA methylase
LSSAALASSVWLVCKKRDSLAKVGWDNQVMFEMRKNIEAQLREFWDAGIRGPDFVWAATGPAMEAYSKHPAVRKANSPTNEFLSVKEFLEAVRRIVIEFVVGRVLHIDSGTDRLDSVTSYYLLHRNDFGFDKAPAGACILYSVSCGISDTELERTWNLVKAKSSSKAEEQSVYEPANEDEDEGEESTEASDEMAGGEFVLRTWKERNEKRMGFESIGGREVPLIDRVHRLMHLWREGDARRVDDYIDQNALRRHELFARLVQSLIELSAQSSEERALLESLSNHLGTKTPKADTTRPLVFGNEL